MWALRSPGHILGEPGQAAAAGLAVSLKTGLIGGGQEYLLDARVGICLIVRTSN